LKSPRNSVAWPLPHDELIVRPKNVIFIGPQRGTKGNTK
jgi:hypothetical protein